MIQIESSSTYITGIEQAVGKQVLRGPRRPGWLGRRRRRGGRGQQEFSSWLADQDVSIDPQFGLKVEAGQMVPTDTSVSYALSDSARSGAGPDPRPDLRGRAAGLAHLRVGRQAVVAEEPLLEFRAVMRRLRAECGWKREQTHRSLARYLVEELHETLEALDAWQDAGQATDADAEHLCEELGDLLLQVYFHAVVAEEAGSFTLDDVARGITEKMRRRNPHVFAPEGAPRAPAGDAAAINDVWQQIKAQEKARESVTDGLPPTLPALLYADKVVDRLAREGAPVEPAGTGTVESESVQSVLGDRLLALVVEAHAAGVDPEQALRDAVRRVALRRVGANSFRIEVESARTRSESRSSRRKVDEFAPTRPVAGRPVRRAGRPRACSGCRPRASPPASARMPATRARISAWASSGTRIHSPRIAVPRDQTRHCSTSANGIA